VYPGDNYCLGVKRFPQKIPLKKCFNLLNGVLLKNPLLEITVQELSLVPLNYSKLQLASFILSFEAVRKTPRKGKALRYHSDASVAF
jgi:hypothetical protein